MRPEHLLGDMVGINPLISNQISRVDGEYFLQTHATNPLLKPSTIDEAIETFFRKDCDSLFSVNVYKKRLYRADLSPVNHDPKNMLRTQDLEPLYEENSNFYVFSRSSFLANGHRIGAHPAVFSMNPLEALDIDDESDFRIVGSVMSLKLAEEYGNGER
jgi:N-acylneuraminate cytidylyltransferase